MGNPATICRKANQPVTNIFLNLQATHERESRRLTERQVNTLRTPTTFFTLEPKECFAEALPAMNRVLFVSALMVSQQVALPALVHAAEPEAASPSAPSRAAITEPAPEHAEAPAVSEAEAEGSESPSVPAAPPPASSKAPAPSEAPLSSETPASPEVPLPRDEPIQEERASSQITQQSENAAGSINLLPAPLPEREVPAKTPDPVPAADIGQTAGFHKGNLNPVFVQSKDGQFRLNLGIYTQARYNMVVRETPNPGDSRFDSGFVFARTRMLFEGKMGPNIHYEFRLQINSEGQLNLLTAYADYDFGAWDISVGRQFIAHMIDDWHFPQNTLTTEYAGTNYAYTIGVVDGVQAFYGQDRFRFWSMVSSGRQDPSILSGGTGEAFGTDARTGMIMFSGRGEFQLIGNNWDLYNDQVSRRNPDHADPGLRLGVAAAYSAGTAGANQTNPTPRVPKNAMQVTADLTASGSGWQVLTQGIWNWFDAPSPESRYGLLVQAGYFITEPWNVYAQYNLVDPGTQRDVYSQYNAVTLGTSLYPFNWSNRYRLSFEGGLLFNPISRTLVGANPTIGWLEADQGNQYYARTELQFGF